MMMFTAFTPAGAQEGGKPDLSKQPTLYVVGYAHLDTEWRWEYPQVIDEYIRKTMEDNFKLFEFRSFGNDEHARSALHELPDPLEFRRRDAAADRPGRHYRL